MRIGKLGLMMMAIFVTAVYSKADSSLGNVHKLK